MRTRLLQSSKWMVVGCVFIIPLLILIGCAPTSPTTQPTILPIQANLTAIATPVQLLRATHPVTELQKDDTVSIQPNDGITVPESGHAVLRFGDRVIVDILRSTEFSVSNVKPEPGDAIFVALKQVEGHTRVRLSENANARVRLETDFASITTLTAGTEFLTCHDPTLLTCLVVLNGEVEVVGQDKVVTVRAGEGTYILKDKPPFPPITAHVDEVDAWLDQKLGTGKVQALGVLVAGWQAATTSAAPTATPAASQSVLACTAIGQTLKRFKDNADIVCIPAGQFLMGSTNNDQNALADEKPAHTVYLDAFWIDMTEVTNAQYNQCVQAGACKPPTPMGGSMPGMPMTTEANQPISDMLWDEAAAYCQWVGGALPTEAQWEKAARGVDGRIYPWGNQLATCDYAVMNDGSGPACGKQGAPWPVGSKPQGASPYGALDMAGNVWEFTSDWYDPHYYANSPGNNPQGPPSGSEHTVRGGSLFMGPVHVRTAFRGSGVIHAVHGSQGFRCAFRSLP